MNDEEKPDEPKQTEEVRQKQVREHIRNSKYFINKTERGEGTAIMGGVRRVRTTTN